MRPLLIIAALLCAAGPARAQDNAPPPGPAQSAHISPMAVPGDQAKFDRGAAAYDAGDYQKAFRIFSKLAEHYDLAAMRNVALMERDGLGTDKDPDAAQEMMEGAAIRGLPTAQSDLAVMLLDGFAGPPNPKAALPWLEKAAAANHPVAQYRLGLLYENGRVVPKDMQRAASLYEAAASRMPEAAERLAALRDSGIEPPPPPSPGMQGPVGVPPNR
jgi:TPR repeat protein